MNRKQYELATLLNALETINKAGHQTLVNEFYETVRQAVHDSTAPNLIPQGWDVVTAWY